ncbi:hypothetical protein OH77DRAFT_1226567 [Trametes cingulata]|nr:hypothetical protein OH77DRAFT_1226567 [Trametes cingulata]
MAPATWQRLLGFLNFKDEKTNRFAVANVPSRATWGRKVDGVDLSRFLCIEDKPVIVWLAGPIVSKWFCNRLGQPQDRVKIGISMLRDEDLAAANGLLSRTMPAHIRAGNNVYASKLMTEWARGEPHPVISSFDQIYDATSSFERKSKMRKLHAYQLGMGDIVLLEVALTRYKTGSIKYVWKEWNVAFELRSVSLLAEAPVGTVSAEPLFPDNEADEVDTVL